MRCRNKLTYSFLGCEKWIDELGKELRYSLNIPTKGWVEDLTASSSFGKNR